jgi:serine/threonine-protein kinase RsbW
VVWLPLFIGPTRDHDGALGQPGAGAQAPGHSVTSTFGGRPEELRRMRACLRPELDGCPAAEDVILCASELASNAVLHSDTRRNTPGTFTVRARICPEQHVLIEVEDNGGPWVERRRHPTTGRGLDIVAALASDWGVRSTAHARTVWARFDWPAS